MINEFKDKKVAILGFGVEGMSVVKFLLKQGAVVFVFDEKPQEEFDKKELDEFVEKGVEFFFGEFPQDFDGFDVVVRSPGVKISNFKFQISNFKLTSPIRIFFDLCPCKIIGVTGTKGKGTTSSLIYEMLKKNGLDAYLGGNIGTPPLDFLDKLKSDSVVVLELSSFQLLDCARSPHIAVVLMITSEHLDYHKDVNEYVQAKRNILRFQGQDDFAVINRDYVASNESDLETRGQIFKVSIERPVERGCFIDNGKVILREKFYKSQKSKVKSQNYNSKIKSCNDSDLEFVLSFGIRASDLSSDVKDMEIIGVGEILLPGRHNLENVCAAVMAAKLAGVEDKNIIHVLKTFKGLEHRLELVAEVEGVRYYDDSFSTTPETAAAAIEAFEEPKILILGGSSKNSDFTHLGEVICRAKNIKAIIGIGVEWGKIKSKIKNQKSKIQFKIQKYNEYLGWWQESPPGMVARKDSSQVDREREILVIEGCKNMCEIVQTAHKIVTSGDVVILSPACASFDMFKNYKDRGNQFKEEVGKLQ